MDRRSVLVAAIATCGSLYGGSGTLAQQQSTTTSSEQTSVLLGDRRLVPGERAGAVYLGVTADELTRVLGKPERSVNSNITYFEWRRDGIAIVVDSSPQTLWIVIAGDAGAPWRMARTDEGVHIGVMESQVRAAFGTPTMESARSGAKYLNFDQRGLRFVIATSGEQTGQVTRILVGWPHVRSGDGLIIPGERIGDIKIGMPVAEVRQLLGGGRLQKPMTEYAVWPHRGLAVETRSLRVIEIHAFTSPGLESAGVRYATREGISSGATETQVRDAFGATRLLGVDMKDGIDGTRRWRVYKSLGVIFRFDDNSRLTEIGVRQRQ